MNVEQVTEQVVEQGKEIAGIKEKLASAHKRIDENDRITEGIHKLASNVESLALQVKLLTERFDSRFEQVEQSQKSQGERIGALEKEPGNKWKDAVKQVVTLIIAAGFGIIATKFM